VNGDQITHDQLASSALPPKSQLLSYASGDASVPQSDLVAAVNGSESLEASSKELTWQVGAINKSSVGGNGDNHSNHSQPVSEPVRYSTKLLHAAP